MAISAYSLTLWKDGQLWATGSLSDPGGYTTLFPTIGFPINTTYTAETIPEGVKVCPNLTISLIFAPYALQVETAEVARRYGYELYEIDIVPWIVVGSIK
jgi:hypothetical protein